MKLEAIISEEIKNGLSHLYHTNEVIHPNYQSTNPQFEGDITLVTFPYTKISKKSPEQTAEDIGNYLVANTAIVEKFNVVKGFLNLVIKENWWLNFFQYTLTQNQFGFAKPNSGKTVMVEYSSPNTNKPLHLGHVRNNLLGHSVAEILKANGNKVIKVNLVNDRGIHICKSMLAYSKFGHNETPESTNMKGDHLVGKYYVEYDKNYKQELSSLKAAGISEEDAPKKSELAKEVAEMLRQWEQNDSVTVDLWRKMNGWVYKGFAETYKNLGVTFDKTYYESETYLFGKQIVQEGLEKGIFFKKEDGSTWIDLTAEKLDEKVVLRADGTSVYITQDLGTAVERANEFNIDGLVYVVGNEQDYHFKVLFKTLEKLGYDWAKNLYHLSYGMVELPEGKMKSREGTVVDADDLITEMVNTAAETTKELGKIEGLTEEQANELFHTIGLGALKYFILKVDPKKKMLFDPKESIDFNGNTGPFIQYTHARIKSLLRKANYSFEYKVENITLHAKEKELIKSLYDFPKVIDEAAKNYSPALVANYIYNLVKLFNQFYHDIPVLKETNDNTRNFRLALSKKVGEVISNGLFLLGINAPEKM